jgi:hypothetical protein
MVEAVAVMPVFVLLFFVAVYAHAWGNKQIDLNTQSRQAAWMLAMSNCNVGGQNDSESLPPTNTGGASNPSVIDLVNMYGSSEAASAAHQAFNAGSVTGWVSSFLSIVTTAIASIFPNPQGAQMNKTDVVNWRLPNNYTGANPTNSTVVRGTATVMCNEAPMDGTLSTVIGDLVGFVGGLF